MQRKYHSEWVDGHSLDVRITEPAFNLKFWQLVRVDAGEQPKPGSLVITLYEGNRRIGKVHRHAIELSNGTSVMKHAVTILGVVKLLSAVIAFVSINV
jgi:hypothetical protein